MQTLLLMLHFMSCCVLTASAFEHWGFYHQTNTRVHVKYVQLHKHVSCETSFDSVPHELRNSCHTPKQINRFPGHRSRPETCCTGKGWISKAAVKYPANRVNERSRALSSDVIGRSGVLTQETHSNDITRQRAALRGSQDTNKPTRYCGKRNKKSNNRQPNWI